MGVENRLHFFRMAAWGMFDPDDLKDRRERKVRLRQIRHVFKDVDCELHISIGGSVSDRGSATYPIYHATGPRTKRSGMEWTPALGTTHKVGPLCAKILPLVDKKFPPKEK